MEYVYELRNSSGIPEYVGQTARLEFRKREHLKYNKKSPFLGRTDMELVPVAEFNTRKEAFVYQCTLQKKYGIVSDKETAKANGYKSINSKAFKLVECPHCKRTGPYSNWIQHHFDNCKHKHE